MGGKVTPVIAIAGGKRSSGIGVSGGYCHLAQEVWAPGGCVNLIAGHLSLLKLLQDRLFDFCSSKVQGHACSGELLPVTGVSLALKAASLC